MLDFSSRMDALEQLTVIINNKCSTEAATYDELDAAITEIWDRVDSIKERTKVLENTLAIVEETLTAADR